MATIADNTTGIAGLAYVDAYCGSYAYSISEEYSAFGARVVISHELGHNLGSIHDGVGTSSTCPESNNNIMTPVSGKYTNTANVLLFSSCSVNAFKTSIYNTV